MVSKEIRAMAAEARGLRLALERVEVLAKTSSSLCRALLAVLKPAASHSTPADALAAVFKAIPMIENHDRDLRALLADDGQGGPSGD